MVRRLIVACAVLMFVSAPLAAQKVEVSVSGGYTASEGIAVDDRVILGTLFNRAEVNSGGSFNFTVGFFASPRAQVEFMFGKQMSTLSGEGPTIKTDVSHLDVYHYHGNFVYHWAGPDAKVRPFAFVGAGATSYAFGEFLIPGGSGNIGNETQFSTTWGGGVKFYAGKNFGFRAAMQWTPTYIKSDPGGYWCDPFYGCWLVGNPDYSHQFDISGGITIRF